MANISKTTTKDIKYFGRDFDSLKKGLIEFAKVYYPNTYNDFNEASPGMMFLEMAAYVGDVLNYYIDSQFKENMLLYATETKNVLAIAAAMGYKPKLSVPSIVEIDIFQLLPATGNGTNVAPDFNYALKIAPGLNIQSIGTNIPFLIQNKIDFSINNVFDPTTISVYSLDNTGAPVYYLAKKTVQAISAQKNTTTVQIGSATKYFKFQIQDPNIIGIDSIIDADGHTWYEVPYLAQDTIFQEVENTQSNDPDAAAFSSNTPYLLKLLKVPRRFITRTTDTGLEVQFGSGVSTSPDEELLATPENIALALPTGKDDIDASIDPAAPIYTGAYGVAPSNTTLTVTYLTGGGIASNVPSNTITQIKGIDLSGTNFPINTPSLNSTIAQSVAVNNPTAAVGGRGAESLDEIRQNALAQLSSQNRAVTKEDYIIRAYAMPNVYGSVAKVHITPDQQNNLRTSELGDTVANPLAMNMYMLGYDTNKNLTKINTAVKENLKTYLGQYRMLTDSVNFRDAYIINIGIDFNIVALPSYNANEALLNCITVLKDYFNIDKWQINQPIAYSDLYNIILTAKGVQTVTNVAIKNLNDTTSGYSGVVYDIAGATKNGIIYPSLDPAIFEVKYPNADIRGRIVTF